MSDALPVRIEISSCKAFWIQATVDPDGSIKIGERVYDGWPQLVIIDGQPFLFKDWEDLSICIPCDGHRFPYEVQGYYVKIQTPADGLFPNKVQ